MSLDVFKVQVRSAPVGRTCAVRRPGDTSDRIVQLTQETSTATVNQWLLVVDGGGVWWAIGRLGTTAAMPDPGNPSPDPEPSGPVLIEVPATWLGSRAWRPHNSTPGSPYAFRSVPSETFAYAGNVRAWSITTPNPNPSYRWEPMAHYASIAGLTLNRMSIQYKAGAVNPAATVRATLWHLPATRPGGQTGHPAGLTLLDDVAIGALAPGGTVTFEVPSGWRSQFTAGTANGLGLAYPTSAALVEFGTPTITPSALQVYYEV